MVNGHCWGIFSNSTLPWDGLAVSSCGRYCVNSILQLKCGWSEWDFRRVYSNIKTEYVAFRSSCALKKLSEETSWPQFPFAKFHWEIPANSSCSPLRTKTGKLHIYLEVLLQSGLLFLLQRPNFYASFQEIFSGLTDYPTRKIPLNVLTYRSGFSAEQSVLSSFFPFLLHFSTPGSYFFPRHACNAQGSSRETGSLVRNPVPLALPVYSSLTSFMRFSGWRHELNGWNENMTQRSPPRSFTLTHCSGNIWQNNIKTPNALQLWLALKCCCTLWREHLFPPTQWEGDLISITPRGEHRSTSPPEWLANSGEPASQEQSCTALLHFTYPRRGERIADEVSRNCGWSLTLHSGLEICIKAS